MTTRKPAEVAGIGDGLIYHYFDDKENIFKEAYERESNAIFLPMLGYIRELRDISLPLPRQGAAVLSPGMAGTTVRSGSDALC